MTTCKQPPGKFVPNIDVNKCEGKGPCIEVCPFDVLEMHIVPKETRQKMSLVGKMKGFVHGWKQAFVAEAERCQACGLCVTACPEKAITLMRNA